MGLRDKEGAPGWPGRVSNRRGQGGPAEQPWVCQAAAPGTEGCLAVQALTHRALTTPLDRICLQACCSGGNIEAQRVCT